ncbi:Uga4p Ecym_4621 [Eremothecium cymbalariae DBVPG|uniref:Amino acid permease/ SLC12A domain-containing protein n=1 Tax=Eremothecium cymbalariae (strain CBS 270.75 / DBVPG 7215 / KCTC 17166 / NRRL Y-17582) TaxID=931890 RepID=G8JSC8_ERECY|nr:hypothetical protein Ecym_4621 [Eremothecium cymbalariae DBVPG\
MVSYLEGQQPSKVDVILLQPALTNNTSVRVQQISSIKTSRSKTVDQVNYINAKTAYDDVELLAEIGYKQELSRHFSTIQVFGIAFSIMGLLPSIASILTIALPGGMVSFVWGWLIFGVFILSIGAAMSELASAIPTSGGLYYYTYYYAPPKFKAILSFLIGNSNSLALVAGLCSVEYGLAQEVLSIVAIWKDGDFELSSSKTFAVYCAAILATVILTSMATAAVSVLQTVSIVINLSLVAFLIVLPIGVANNDSMTFNGPGFIFANFQNNSSWPDCIQFFLCGSLPIVWVIGAFDSTIHMSEEAKNASKAVPVDILTSITVCWLLGFCIVVTIAACMGPDINGLLDTAFGQPLAQLLFNVLGKQWAIAFMSLIAVCQYVMGASILTAISRQIWAFARDDGLPFSFWIKKVNKSLSSPIRATWVGAFAAIMIGLLTLAGPVASSALFSMYVGANYLAWMMPNLLRMLFGKNIFNPGVFYMGKFWSPIINWVSIIFQLLCIVLMMLPTNPINITGSSMNYTFLFTGFVWFGSIIYFVLYKHKTFEGPKSNLTDSDLNTPDGSIEHISSQTFEKQ